MIMEDSMKIACHISIGLVLVAWAFSLPATASEPAFSDYDQLKMRVQRICPVSGDELGTKGDPVKVKIGQEEIFLCSGECAKGKIDKTHWVQIHRNFAEAQGICPVMEKPLPANPKSTTVNGQTVYICCPPCSKKIQAEPRKYLTKLAGYYVSAISKPSGSASTTARNSTEAVTQSLAKLNASDRLRATAQKICPVSGNELGRMGVPKKVRVGKLDVFLCCEGCAEGKVSNELWAKVAENIKSAQGKCPVMEKPLPANAKSTIVNGQLVFVCCPPCIKKIEAAPTEYLTKIDRYYQQAASQQTLISGKQRTTR